MSREMRAQAQRKGYEPDEVENMMAQKLTALADQLEAVLSEETDGSE